MKFKICGPFSLEKGQNGLPKLDKESKKKFWENISLQYPGLSEACGCYVFAIKAGKGVKPWYVGKTGKQVLSKEVFTPHKEKIFQSVVAKRKGTPILFFIPLLTNQNRFSKKRNTNHRGISFLENLLIGACINKNSRLSNVQKTKYLREMVVPGFLNSPKRKYSREEREFVRTIIGYENRKSRRGDETNEDE